MRLFGRGPLSYSLQSKLSPFCNRKLPPISHTSSMSANIRNFNSTVFMRKTLFPKMLSKALIDDSKAMQTLKFRIGHFVYTVALRNALAFFFALRNALAFSHCRQWCF